MVKKQSKDDQDNAKRDLIAKDGRFRIREDGALCWGGDCLVIKQEPTTKDVRISFDETKCGGLALEAYKDLIDKTVARGGKTIYDVPAEIKTDDK